MRRVKLLEYLYLSLSSDLIPSQIGQYTSPKFSIKADISLCREKPWAHANISSCLFLSTWHIIPSHQPVEGKETNATPHVLDRLMHFEKVCFLHLSSSTRRRFGVECLTSCLMPHASRPTPCSYTLKYKIYALRQGPWSYTLKIHVLCLTSHASPPTPCSYTLKYKIHALRQGPWSYTLKIHVLCLMPRALRRVRAR